MDGAVWAGLLGVVIGGLLSGMIGYLSERRREHAQGRSVERLVLLELVTNQARAQRLLGAEEWSEDLPFEVAIWTTHREALARALSNDAWMVVALAYFAIEAANARRRNGSSLAAADRDILHGVVENTGSALDDLASKRIDTDLEKRRLRLYTAVAASSIDRPE